MGVRDEVGAREGQEHSDTTNAEAVRRTVGMRGLPRTWRNAHCWTWPGSQKTAIKQRESTQSCAVTPKDTSRQEEHRTASRTPAERRRRGGRRAGRNFLLTIQAKSPRCQPAQSSRLHVTGDFGNYLSREDEMLPILVLAGDALSS